jgi:hypothetical protein
MGRSKTTRSLVYCTAGSSAARPMPTASIPVIMMAVARLADSTVDLRLADGPPAALCTIAGIRGRSGAAAAALANDVAGHAHDFDDTNFISSAIQASRSSPGGRS